MMPSKSFAKIIWGWVIVGLIILLFNSNLISARPTMPDSVVPYATIEIDETNKTGHVAPGESCQVMFNGNVTITCSPGTRMEVSLKVIPVMCFAYVTPPVIDVYRSSEVPFEISVILNQEESCKNVPTVTVWGMWKIIPSGREGSVNPEEGVTCTVTIAPFYKFSVNSGKSYDEIKPGSKVEYGITIINEGNDDDTFFIDIINFDDLADEGFEVTASHSQITIPEKDSSNVIIFVEAPASIDVTGSTNILVEINSQKGSQNNLNPETVTLEVIIPLEDFIFTTEFYLIIFIIIILIVVGSIIYLKWRKKKAKNYESN